MTGPPPHPSAHPSHPEQPPVEAVLYEAGFPVDLLTEEQRLVLSELTPQELTLLLDVKNRLDAVGPEVQAHGEIAGGALF
ncbi:aroma-sacti cluster domain-containing protein [Streptomyces cyaneofuscatus]|uniref:aroma-sacti cluster domain-containing protein n=1 Tax=Streptomyces cyaneofuscatus TaxID=66883 RepID=UPI0038218D6C